ncbi:MAG: flagellar hook capping FlgD N-terminal domain-containing protein [Pseudomonadota bacterium]
MDQITSASSASSLTSRPSTEESSQSDAAASLATDFETFLTLLTTQLRAQDPLSPVDSTQFVEQLASFSSVEQQIQTNDKLDSIANALGQGDAESIASWIGQSVETQLEGVRFEGQPISFNTDNAANYDTVTASIQDAEGNVIGRIDLDKDQQTHVWRGEDGNGGRVLNGDYTINVEYRRDGNVVKSGIAPQVGIVEEARLTAEGWRLQLNNGAFIQPDDVTAILADEPVA